MTVELKDRNTDIEHFRMALAMCEVNANYRTCDLMLKVLAEVNLRGGGFSLLDAARIHSDWHSEWKNYDKQKENQNEKQTI
jgi:hypothetical protein